MRAALEDARDAVKRDVDAAWQPINQSRQHVDIGPLKTRFDQVTGGLSEASRMGDVPAVAGIPEKLLSARSTHPLNEITGLRSALTDAQRAAAAAQTPIKARVAGQYVDAVDDHMANELPSNIQQGYNNARRATFDFKNRFERGGTGIGDVLARRRGGTPRVPDNDVTRRFVQNNRGRTPDLSALMREAGGDKRVQDSVRDHLLHDVQDAKLLKKPEVLNKWLADHKAVFEHFPELKKEIGGAASLRGKLDQAQNAENSLIKELTASNGGPIARYLRHGDENAKQAMRGVLSAKTPAKDMDEILSFVKDDPEAVEGARKVFWDVLEDTAKSKGSTTATLDGIQPWIPGKLKAFLGDPRYSAVDLGGATPDENTIRLFRNRLSETGTLKRVMKAFEGQLHEKGYIPMSGQIVDASLVPAPRQRNTQAEKAAIKAGKAARQIWPDQPNKAAQKDVDARWTLKTGGQVRHRPDGTPLPMIATPVFGYKSHIGIDRRFGFIRKAKVTSASQVDGRQLRHVIDTDKTASDVWADSAYRSRRNETWLAGRMLKSRIHRRKPAGKPMPEATRRANATKSSVRARIEHVFAHQKTRFGLFIRTIGIERAEAKLTLANLACNFDRLIFHERRGTMG